MKSNRELRKEIEAKLKEDTPENICYTYARSLGAFRELCKIIGVDVRACHKYRMQNKERNRYDWDKLDSIVIVMFKNKESIHAISTAIGVSYPAVRKRLITLGLLAAKSTVDKAKKERADVKPKSLYEKRNGKHIVNAHMRSFI